MTDTLRYSDTVTQSRYPLNIIGAIQWRPVNHPEAVWKFELKLTGLQADEILVPSFVCPDASGAFQFSLSFGADTCTLNAVPATQAAQNNNNSVTSQIDYFKINSLVEEATLRLQVISARAPVVYLLVVSRRQNLVEESLPTDAPTLEIPQRSQMCFPQEIRNRICSPVCVAMVLDSLNLDVDMDKLLAASRDKVTGLFGIWPLNLFAACQQGALGAVECFENWQQVCELLERSHPVILSIRFAPGELPDSPLTKTDGHLVVARGISDNKIWVNDPARDSDDNVYVGYDSLAFSKAWLNHRGIAYVLA